MRNEYLQSLSLRALGILSDWLPRPLENRVLSVLKRMRIALTIMDTELRQPPSSAITRAPSIAAMAIGLGLAISILPPLPQQGHSVLLAVLLLLNLIALTVAVSHAGLIGFLIGGYTLLTSVVGWTVSSPGIPIAILTVVYMIFIGLLGSLRQPLIPRSALTSFPGWVIIFPALPALANALLARQSLTFGMRALNVAAWILAIWVIQRESGIRLGWGFVAGTHLILTSLIACGAYTSLAETPIHSMVESYVRFGGGTCAYAHPTIVGMSSWTLMVAWLFLPSRLGFLGRLVGFVTAAGLLLLTDSRTAIVAGVVAAAAGTATRLTRRMTPALKVSIVALFLLLVVGVGLFFSGEFVFQERTQGGGVLTGRQHIWEAGLADFRNSPGIEKLLGTSEGGASAEIELAAPNGRAVNFAPHNALLGLLRRSGLIGLALGLIGLFLVMRATVGMLSTPKLAIGVGLLLGAALTIPVEAFFYAGSLSIWILLAWRLREETVMGASLNHARS